MWPVRNCPSPGTPGCCPPTRSGKGPGDRAAEQKPWALSYKITFYHFYGVTALCQGRFWRPQSSPDQAPVVMKFTFGGAADNTP